MDDHVVFLEPGDFAGIPWNGAAGEDQAACLFLLGQGEFGIAPHRHLAFDEVRLAGTAIAGLAAERVGEAGIQRRLQDGGAGGHVDGAVGLGDADFEAHRVLRARICLLPKQSPFTTGVMGRPLAKSLAETSTTSSKVLDRGILPTLLGYMLRRAQSAVFADFAATFQGAGASLTPGEFGLLVLVARNTGLSQMALARALGIDRSTLVPILDRLQARDLLVRRRSPTDGRTHALELTPAGAKELARFTTLVRVHEKRIASRLSTAETQMLIGLLEKVRAGARSL